LTIEDDDGDEDEDEDDSLWDSAFLGTILGL
jgi:hypothetical protein